MTSAREQALQGLFLCLQSGITGPEVLRSEILPTAIPNTGLLILRDGDLGSPEITLSPVRYHFEHRAEIEVIVQDKDASARDLLIDGLLAQIAAAVLSDQTLSGSVDFAHLGSPEFMDEAIEGAPALKAAVVPITLEYSTSNPLT
jgi:hypothetical protein